MVKLQNYLFTQFLKLIAFALPYPVQPVYIPNKVIGCTQCGCVNLIKFSTVKLEKFSDIGYKECSNCGYQMPWHLKDKQIPLVASNRRVKRENVK